MHSPWIWLLLAICLSPTHRIAAQDAAEERYQRLFDGSLAGWHGDNPHQTARVQEEDRTDNRYVQQTEFSEHWSIDGDELVNDGHGPYATTDQEYGDIELLLEYKTVGKADSGIYLRGTPQVQIWDTTEAGGKWDRHADYGSGGLFNNTKNHPGQLPLRHADRPFGQWNQFRIVQIGSRTWVELNDLLVVDGAIMENYWDKDRVKPLPAKGQIHLQTHGGEIRWRDLMVREIGSEEAISRLRGDDAKFGFESIFNGQDLSGWTGAADDYEVIQGAIVCKPGRGGVLFTEKQYENFAVRLEFKLPPGGNNGLAIRYPGSGQASYDGMCELQVLDNPSDKYAQLDPRQYHGSVYGMAAAHRGYLRPTGEWNFQEVTVEGSRIRVELNGTPIVDADVSQIDNFMADRPHPGKDLRHGHFGFAGHNDPVMFRRIAIKELPATPVPAKQTEPGGLIFYASFDDTTDANLSTGDGFLQVADSTKREVLGRTWPEGVAIEPGGGRWGDALRFRSKSSQVLFYEGIEAGYSPTDWSGSVSLWLSLDPDQDLEPGFCDPIQMSQKSWNDGAFFVDFDKELPRDFRLGVFSDYKVWNPTDTNFDDIPVEQRPMVVVRRPPFSTGAWTHVCYTWQNVNATDKAQPSVARLYLNGELHGEIKRPLTLTWDPEKAAIMIGLNYIGLMDELKIFDRALTDDQIQWLQNQ